MKKKFLIILAYILIFFNSNFLGADKNISLKIGLLAPLSGEYKELGESLLYSLQLALDEINDKNVIIIPKDTGSDDKEKLGKALEEMRLLNVNVVIGPIDNDDFSEVKKFSDIVFVSPSNKNPDFQKNMSSSLIKKF